jgi:hypothetical protein
MVITKWEKLISIEIFKMIESVTLRVSWVVKVKKWNFFMITQLSTGLFCVNYTIGAAVG